VILAEFCLMTFCIYALLKNIDFYFEMFFFPIIVYLNFINEDCQFSVLFLFENC